MQAEKNNAQQSLFGGGGVVDIQPPTVPSSYDWTQLETLNHERDMMGLYLTAHPLDEYKLIIDNMCKTRLSELSDLESLKGQEICVAGLVVAAQPELTTRTGRSFGKLTLEDYNSSFEFAFFGKDYENFRKFIYPNYYLMVRCKVQPRPYQKEGEEERLELKVLSITQLHEVRETMIKELHLQLPVEQITDSFIRDFTKLVKHHKGNTTLRMVVYDNEGVALRLFSKRYRVDVAQELVDYLTEQEIKFTIS